MQNQSKIEPEHEEKLTEEEESKLEEMMQTFGRGLHKKFDINVGLKEEIEQRWLNDLRHYHGINQVDKNNNHYSDISHNNEKTNRKGSQIFVNLTRSKCNSAESKWADLVLPTDDRNWGIKTTPVPELAKLKEDESPVTLSDGTPVNDPDTGEAYQNKDIAEEEVIQIEKAAKLMEREIDDQLVEAKYNASCRRIIHDAVVIGTAVIKGPMVENRVKKAWLENEDGEWELSTQSDKKPTAQVVDPWNYFPDMSAVRKEDCEFEFERHLMTPKDIRKLAKNGFIKSQLNKLLAAGPNAQGAKLTYLNELREMNGVTQINQDNRYEVIEYHGPIDKQDLITCGCKIDPDNHLEEYDGVVWFSNGIVIKVGLHHMDSNESVYSVLTWEKDETNIFGFGIPFRMNNSQRVINASWRMILDNAGLSTGPQIVINKSIVEPVNSKWKMEPRKLWIMTSKDPRMKASDAFSTFNIESKQPELTNIFEKAKQLSDEETSVPQSQIGGQSPDTQQPAMLKTLGGTQLWMSSNNIMMRKAVKNFDDDITAPLIGRFYDWNMQFNKKTEIKGDFNIEARGSSVLLVREMQSRNITEFVNIAMALPGGPDELEVRGILKNVAKGMQISVNDVLVTDDKAEENKKKAEENPQQDPEMLKINAQKELKQMDIDANKAEAELAARERMTALEGERQIALINRELELTKLAAEKEVNIEKIRSEAGIKKYSIDWDIKSFYEETKIKQEQGTTANFGLD